MNSDAGGFHFMAGLSLAGSWVFPTSLINFLSSEGDSSDVLPDRGNMVTHLNDLE